MSTATTTAAGVRFDQISKTFRMTDGDLHVLDRVSFTAEPGEFVAILGPSGSGKSTSLGVIAGLVEPDSGSFDAPDKSHVGYVFQNPRLLPWRTVEENLLIARAARRQAGAPAFTHDVDYYLDLVGLLNYKRYFPAALSGGMQQRTSIARALAVQPSLLLMDEPFSSLDELTAREQRSYLLRIWEHERTTVLFVTHNVLEAITLATSIVVVSERPAHVIEQIPVDLPRPRRLNSEAALALQLKILNMLGVDDPNALS